MLKKVQIPMRRVNFEGKGASIVNYTDSLTLRCELCKNGWTNRDAIWGYGLWWAQENVLEGVHIFHTRRIRINRPCVAAMRPFCQISLTTCFFSSQLVLNNRFNSACNDYFSWYWRNEPTVEEMLELQASKPPHKWPPWPLPLGYATGYHANVHAVYY